MLSYRLTNELQIKWNCNLSSICAPWSPSYNLWPPICVCPLFCLNCFFHCPSPVGIWLRIGLQYRAWKAFPPCSKAKSTEWGPKFCSPSSTLMMFHFKEWNIFELDVKQYMIHQPTTPITNQQCTTHQPTPPRISAKHPILHTISLVLHSIVHAHLFLSLYNNSQWFFGIL